MLKWRSHKDMLGAVVAVGLRGEYSIQRFGREFILEGVGHDGLSMPALGVEGNAFPALSHAQAWAEHLDDARNARGRESYASGC